MADVGNYKRVAYMEDSSPETKVKVLGCEVYTSRKKQWKKMHASVPG